MKTTQPRMMKMRWTKMNLRRLRKARLEYEKSVRQIRHSEQERLKREQFLKETHDYGESGSDKREVKE